MSTRMLITKSWNAVKRMASQEQLGMVTFTPSTLAGLYLEAADGDTERAIALVPDDTDGVFFPLVRMTLDQVLAEERADRGPRLKTGT